MSTIQSVKNQIQTLIDNANATTGKGDTNLTTAQNSLIEGYGQGGGGGGFSGHSNVLMYGGKYESGIYKVLEREE